MKGLWVYLAVLSRERVLQLRRLYDHNFLKWYCSCGKQFFEFDFHYITTLIQWFLVHNIFMLSTQLSPVQTDAQQCWMLHVVSICTPCYMMLGVVIQSLKLVKILSQKLPTFLLFRDRWRVVQQCWIRLHSSFQHGWGRARTSQMVYKTLWVVSFPGCTVGSFCIHLHTTTKTDATTPNIIDPNFWERRV